MQKNKRIMQLYQQYSYNPAFCAFRKVVAELICRYLMEHTITANVNLCISRYLEITIQDKGNELQKDSDNLIESILLDELVMEQDGSLHPDYDKIESLALKYIIEPSKKPETKWDVLNSQMIRDYENHMFPNDIFDPYIMWKKSEISCDDISIEQIDKMSEEADRLLELYESKHPQARLIHDTFIVDDPWQFTRGYGDDKYIVAYLQYISDQLSDLHLRNWC